jgi:hypothetical protein
VDGALVTHVGRQLRHLRCGANGLHVWSC